MATTNFIDGVTPVPAAWLNDVNNFVYNLLGFVAVSSNATTPVLGVLQPPFHIHGAIMVVRNITLGGTALFIIDETGAGASKIGGGSNIVLGAPGSNQLGVNGLTGQVTNNYGVPIFISSIVLSPEAP